jgi:hypothetical protein
LQKKGQSYVWQISDEGAACLCNIHVNSVADEN